jgi:hypothetical protein
MLIRAHMSVKGWQTSGMTLCCIVFVEYLSSHVRFLLNDKNADLSYFSNWLTQGDSSKL